MFRSELLSALLYEFWLHVVAMLSLVVTCDAIVAGASVLVYLNISFLISALVQREIVSDPIFTKRQPARI